MSESEDYSKDTPRDSGDTDFIFSGPRAHEEHTP